MLGVDGEQEIKMPMSPSSKFLLRKTWQRATVRSSPETHWPTFVCRTTVEKNTRLLPSSRSACKLLKANLGECQRICELRWFFRRVLADLIEATRCRARRTAVIKEGMVLHLRNEDRISEATEGGQLTSH